jgi:sporulation protein YlmC with PRC-barrel domain
MTDPRENENELGDADLLTSSILGLKVFAEDGVVGKAQDVLFDERDYTVRHLVVRSGLFRPRVVVSPSALVSVDRRNGLIRVAMTCDQIRGGPRLVTGRRVQRTQRTYLWSAVGLATGTGGGLTIETPVPDLLDKGDPNLRSVREVTGYRVVASDGAVGSVEDFAVTWPGDRGISGGQDWQIRGMLVRQSTPVDRQNARSVLLPPLAVAAIQWKEETVYLRLACEDVKRLPEWIMHAE